MKLYATVFLLLIVLYAHGQNIAKSDLKYTEWCVDNSNNHFYKSDTVRLYRFLDTLSEQQKLNIYYRQLDFNNGKNITKIKLKKNGRVEISDHDVSSWTEFKRLGKWKWEFDVATQNLNLFYEKESTFSFVVIRNYEDSLVWKPEGSVHFPKEETYHLRILELVRLK